MDLCNHSCSSGRPAILRDKNFNVRHCTQTFNPFLFKPTMRVGSSQMQKRIVRVESHGCKRRRTMTYVPAVSECDFQRHWQWSWSHNPVTVHLLKLDRMQNEAMRLILGTRKGTPIDNMRYGLDLPSIETRHKVEQVKVYLCAM